MYANETEHDSTKLQLGVEKTFGQGTLLNFVGVEFDTLTLMSKKLYTQALTVDLMVL